MSQGESVQFPFAGLPFLLASKSHALLQILSILFTQHLWLTPRKKQPCCLHIRSYPIPKGFQPYKGMHAYTNGSVMSICIDKICGKLPELRTKEDIA